MAVYKKTYRRYEGAMTPAWSRFLILARYNLAEMRESRFYITFFWGASLPPLICALIIYLRHNASALTSMGLEPSRILNIDTGFFLNFLGFQAMLAFFVAAFRGPGLVSPDLANNALPLYLARPFSRTEYVLGRMSVLAILLSFMMWVPGLLLYSLQAYLEGWSWLAGNARIAMGLFVGSWIWILLLSLLVLALSAWVKWRPVAGGMLFIIMFVGAGVANAFNQILDSRWGHLFNISHLMGMVWVWLFGQPMELGAGAAFFRIQPGEALPLWTVWAALAGLCLVCLWLLGKKVRGMEVVS